MTVRNLSSLFHPSAVALIGASERSGSLGHLVLRNLRAGGFDGEVFAVNPKYDAIDGFPCYPSVARLPRAPDLAVIVTAPKTVPGLVKELAGRGTRAAVVITAGFGETGDRRGARLQQAMLDAARPFHFRLVGPNCVGLMVPGIGLNASFAHLQPLAGNIAVLAQSGAILTAMIDWATERKIGFSHLVSLGGMADVDFGDALNYFAEDDEVHALLLYVESITHARKFMSAARAASRLKPVIVLKAGRFETGAKAAASHTGALAGSDDVYDAAFARAGLLRVFSIAELFDMAETVAYAQRLSGDRLAIVTNGGGMGVLAADALAAEGGRLAELSKDTLEKLDRALPSTWSRGNPVDVIGDAPPQRYAAALQALAQDENVDAILAMHCPVATVAPVDAAQAVISADSGRVPVLTSWVGGLSMGESRVLFAKSNIPSYDSPAEAVHGFMQLVRYRRNQAQLMETPPLPPEPFDYDREAAAGVIEQALAEGRSGLNEREVAAVLAAYAIPTAPTRLAADPDEAVRRAAEFDGPVALKIASADIGHKSDVGGVALNLKNAEQVRAAAEDMLRRVREQAPKARIEGFSVQLMVRWPGAFELILGVVDDPLFGPVLLFGHGGTAVEVIDDTALALPPLNMKLARELIARTRVARLLAGYRDQPPADRDAIALTLVKLSQLISDLPPIVELDVNPLLASSRGVLALDTRIRVSAENGPERLAIRPYPRELEESVELPDGHRFILRPIRAEDKPALQRSFEKLDPKEIRLRFHYTLKVLDHKLAARLTQIDYDREMALVLTDADGADIHAVVRLVADPDRERAEFAIIVGRWLTGRGLGRRLMQRLIAYARRQGIGELFGSVSEDNEVMLGLCRRLGFTQEADKKDSGLAIVRLDLKAQRS